MLARASTNRIESFIFDQIVELFFCIYDLVEVGTVGNVDLTARTLVEMTPQWVNLGLASDAPHGKTQVLALYGLPPPKPPVRNGVTTSPSVSS